MSNFVVFEPNYNGRLMCCIFNYYLSELCLLRYADLESLHPRWVVVFVSHREGSAHSASVFVDAV